MTWIVSGRCGALERVGELSRRIGKTEDRKWLQRANANADDGQAAGRIFKGLEWQRAFHDAGHVPKRDDSNSGCAAYCPNAVGR